MKRCILFLLCLLLLLPLLAACGAAPDEIRLDPLDLAQTPALTRSDRSVRVSTPFGPAITADLPSPAPTEVPVPTAAPDMDPVELQYILNTSSKRFHLPDCSSVRDMKASNREDYIGTRDALLARGYKPCGRCNP